ncbi:FTR1 family protein [Paenibacillus sp. D2_2]|uniref:FTR1 family iron permease n=1 Tax=Paenibacillus sp. D2_2 TaxID=3073092 RepID=UPI0028165A7B|nr:FTR1 family protein [Paenibacillus sp. D2_2]WMT40179.1 FTR1 family protein [Paenibacillus sp. D2_2]
MELPHVKQESLNTIQLKFATVLLAFILIITAFWSVPVSATRTASDNASDPTYEKLLPLIGGALVEVGTPNWDTAAAELSDFSSIWNTLDHSASPELAKEIEDGLTAAKNAIEAQDQRQAKLDLSSLAKKVNEYTAAHSADAEKPDGKESASQLLDMTGKTLSALEQGSEEQAQAEYKQILNTWKKLEGPIRGGNFNVYSDIETHMSLIRIALQAVPVRTEQAIKELTTLNSLLQDYTEGKLDSLADSSSTQKNTLVDTLPLLEKAKQAVAAKNAEQAAEQMSQFIKQWPSVEGEVSVSSAKLYTSTENRMAEAQSYLISSPPNYSKAEQIIEAMIQDLQPLAERSAYTAWDAALILLREGFEALLVLTALLAFVNRSKDTALRTTIWAGAGTGLLISAILAIILTYTISQAISGGAREMIEGFTGLFAVVMMLTIGWWLHSKSSVKAWNQYLSERTHGAIQRGSRWSLFLLSALAILREGAETTIFYIGMIPSIQPHQLIIGILGALIVLVVLGFCLIYFGIKLPIRPFMLCATLLIYYLVVRFLGESIHSLQIAGLIPAHSQSWLPSAGWIGAYPTWETMIPQLLVLLFIIWQLTRRNSTDSHRTSSVS